MYCIVMYNYFVFPNCRSDLLLDAFPGTDEPNHFVEPHKNVSDLDKEACKQTNFILFSFSSPPSTPSLSSSFPFSPSPSPFPPFSSSFPSLFSVPPPQEQEEQAACVWDLIQNCLNILDISPEEAMGLWCLLAAIYHLGHAGVNKGDRITLWQFFLEGSDACSTAKFH